VRQIGLTSVRQDSCGCWRSIVPKPSTRSPGLANPIPAAGAQPCCRWHSDPGARPFRLKRAAGPLQPTAPKLLDETRPVAKFSLCCVLPVSRSHPHCLVSPAPPLFFFLLPLSLLPFSSRSSSQKSRRHFGKSRRSAFPEVGWTAFFTHRSREEKQIKIF
jgi:hypothetical protein